MSTFKEHNYYELPSARQSNLFFWLLKIVLVQITSIGLRLPPPTRVDSPMIHGKIMNS